MSRSGSVLILGGGVMQLPALRAARELGLAVWMADGNPECVGRGHADAFLPIDLRDRQELAGAAATIPGLRGVFTAGTDFSTSVAWVAEQLGLPGIPYAVARRATDKGLMRATLRGAGIAVPEFVAVDADLAPEELRAEVRRLRMPIVVKPVDSMGSRGVERVDDREGIEHAVATAGAVSRSGRVILEEFVSGRELSIDALVSDGRVFITGVADRHIHFPPFFVELGHTLPADLDPAALQTVLHTFTAAVAALGIRDGAAKGDVFLSEDEPPRAVIGEIAARLSGGFMSGWTFPLSSGVAVTRHAIRIAVGERIQPADLVPTRAAVVAERALVSAPGRVVGIDAPDGRSDRIAERFINRSIGDVVVSPRNNVEKVANVIGVGKTREEASARAVEALDRIVFRLDPANRETRTFMFETGWRGPYARYRCDSRDERPPAPEERAPRSASRALPVAVVPPPFALSRVRPVQPAVRFATLIERLQRDGLIRVVPRGSAYSLGLEFWRAVLAAGAQGASFSIDVLLEGGSIR